MSFSAIISADIKKFEQGIDKAQGLIDGLEKNVNTRLTSIGNKFQSIGAKMSIITGALTVAGGAAFKMAADFEDALGATEQVFGDASDAAKDFANNLEAYYGIAKKEAVEYQNLMGTMLKEIGGLTEKTAQSQASDLLKLGGDLTAMYGGTVTEAVNALTSAMTGMTLPLRKYGVAITDATATQKALEMGLIATSSQMTPQIKQAAILALIWEQTSAAQGQAARESETASGAMRRFTTEVKNLSTAFGEVLLPVITPIITKINEFVQRLNELDPTAKKIIVVVAGITAAIGPLLIGLGQILKILPLIKIAIASLSGPIGAIIAVAVAGIATIIANWDMLKSAVVKDIDYIKNEFSLASDSMSKLFEGDFKGAWENVKASFDNGIDYLKRRWSELKEFFGIDADASADAGIAVGGLSDVISQLGTETEETNNNLNGLGDGIEDTARRIEDTRNTFDKFIASTSSINEAVFVTTQTIANLKQRILDLQTGKLFSDDITGEIQEYTNLIKEFETGLDTLTRGTWNVDFTINNKLPEESKFVLPEIDATGMVTSLQRANEMILDVGSLINSGVQGIAQSIGQALGEGNFSDLGKGLMSALGRLAQQFGGMLISFGTASLALKKLIVDPFTAIAVGAGLVALGAAATASASKMMNSATSGGYTGGTSSYQTAPTYGPSEYRGAYMDDWAKSVEFKISGDSLVGTLERANNKSSRLG